MQEASVQYNAPYGVSDPNAPYVNGNPTTGTMGSIPPAASIEFPQREIVGLIGACGFTPDNADLLQLAKAVQSGLLNFAVDTGTANNYQIAVNPALLASKPGNRWYVKIANTSTGPSTLNVNGIGAKPIVYGNGDPLITGDLTAGGIAEFFDNGARFELSPTHTSPLSGTRAALSGVRMFTTPGPTLYVPTVGTRAVLVEVLGGGGGGGGSYPTGAGQVSFGVAGGAGGYARKFITSGFANVSLVVGAQGAGGVPSGGTGGTGGTSSFGAILTCAGGNGGVSYPPQSVGPGNSTTAGGGSASGGDINVFGQYSYATITLSNGGAVSGWGGSTMYGQTGLAFGISTNGGDGQGYGSGATAAISLVSAATGFTGGRGAQGLVIVWEYA
jgi:hypothetical protein